MRNDCCFFEGVEIAPSGFGKYRKQVSGGICLKNKDAEKRCFQIGRLENMFSVSHKHDIKFHLETAVFGGYNIAHFGHFITESIGRIPNAPLGVSRGPLIFLAGNRKSLSFAPWQLDLLKALGWGDEVLLLTEKTKVDHLWVPEIAFHQNGRPFGTPRSRIWRDEIFANERDSCDKLKIYVSRRKLSGKYGRFEDEKMLEEFLKINGYQVIYPEQLHIKEQIEYYRKAERIILAESSALHLMNLVCSDWQSILMIARRPDLHSSLKKPTRFFARANVVIVEAINEFNIMCSNEKKHAGVSHLDYKSIFKVIEEMGYLEDNQTCHKERLFNSNLFKNNDNEEKGFNVTEVVKSTFFYDQKSYSCE